MPNTIDDIGIYESVEESSANYNTLEAINNAIAQSRAYFEEKVTLNLTWRLEFATQISKHLKINEDYLLDALVADLGISRYEAYQTELAPVYDEAIHMRKNIHKIFKIAFRKTQRAFLPMTARTYSHPLGVVCISTGIESPLLTPMIAAIDAMSAGNCVIMKTSDRTPEVSEAIHQMISAFFRPEYFLPICGGAELDELLLQGDFDGYYFSGTREIGTRYGEVAGRRMKPAVINLGGNCPVYVDDFADVSTAAKKIMWGKLVHAGQLTTSPSYVLVNKFRAAELVDYLVEYIESAYGEFGCELSDIIEHQDYPRMLDSFEFDKVVSVLESRGVDSEIIYGGGYSRTDLKIEPTIILTKSFDDPIFKERITGPILPILQVDDIDGAAKILDKIKTPPALYVFTASNVTKRNLLEYFKYGGGCVNDVLLQGMSPSVPFGGFKDSGIGNVSGKFGFESFSHKQGVIYARPSYPTLKRFAPFLRPISKIARKNIYPNKKLGA